MSNNDTYWANVRILNKPTHYIELTDLGNGKWDVVLDFDEFKIKSTSQDFYTVLAEAIAQRPS